MALLAALAMFAGCDDDPNNPVPDQTDTDQIDPDVDQVDPDIEEVTGCQSNADCVGDAAGPICNTGTGACVECMAAIDCEAGEVCNTTTYTCETVQTGCQSDADCAEGVCNTTTEQCVECMVDGDCETGEVCNLTTYTCELELTGCTADADCVGDPAGEVCNTTSGACVECMIDGDCETGETCNMTTYTCEAEQTNCSSNADCVGAAAGEICDTVSGLCVECLVDENCETGEVCNMTTYTCELEQTGCTSNADCVGDPAGAICNTTSGDCVECMIDDNCGTGEVCNMTTYTCELEQTGCTSNADCMGDPAGAICNTTSGECVECMMDSNCTDGEVCNMTTYTCEAGACDLNGIAAFVSEGIIYNGRYGSMDYSGYTAETGDLDALFISMDPAVTAGTYDLATSDSFFVYTVRAVGGVNAFFVATAGSIEIVAYNPELAAPFVANLSNLTLGETDDEGTPLPAGREWCISGIAIDTVYGYVTACTGSGDCDTENPICGADGYCIPVAGWTCHPSYYGDSDCDCGCGALDIDCDGPAASFCDYRNCPEGTVVDEDENWLCETFTVPTEWTCDATWYGDGECDCGCGALDIDCAGPEASACTWNNCPTGEVPVADQNWLCFQAPAGWTCNAAYYNDGVCDCGCGILDPECAGSADTDCDENRCGPGQTVNAIENWLCEGGGGWTCTESWYSDADCDCGCGIIDPACTGPEDTACDYEWCDDPDLPAPTENWLCLPPAPDCLDNTDCAGDPAGEICDTVAGECVECVDNGDCTGAGEVCQLNFCVDPTACTYDGFTPVDQYCERDDSFPVTYYQGRTSTTDPYDFVTVEFYRAAGGPGAYELGATVADQNYATCENCVLVGSGCTSGAGCAQIFFATGGTVNVTSWGDIGGTFSGTLENARLIEVTIAGGTYTSTPVPGGDTWCITSMPFTATVE
jgi:hypothetical protein